MSRKKSLRDRVETFLCDEASRLQPAKPSAKYGCSQGRWRNDKYKKGGGYNLQKLSKQNGIFHSLGHI